MTVPTVEGKVLDTEAEVSVLLGSDWGGMWAMNRLDVTFLTGLVG